VLIPKTILGSLTVSVVISCRCVILPNYWECTLLHLSQNAVCRCAVLPYEGSTHIFTYYWLSTSWNRTCVRATMHACVL